MFNRDFPPERRRKHEVGQQFQQDWEPQRNDQSQYEDEMAVPLKYLKPVSDTPDIKYLVFPKAHSRKPIHESEEHPTTPLERIGPKPGIKFLTNAPEIVEHVPAKKKKPGPRTRKLKRSGIIALETQIEVLNE